MTRRKEDPWIELTVTNPEAVHYTGSLRKSFDRKGGTIGSRGADWILLDPAQGVAAVHCEVVTVDGAFCLIDRSGLTRMNRSESGMGLRRIALLRDGDTVTIGDFRIGVHIVDRAIDHPARDSEQRRPSAGIFADTHPSDDQADPYDDVMGRSTGHVKHGFFLDVGPGGCHAPPAYPNPAGSWDQAFIASHRISAVAEEHHAFSGGALDGHSAPAALPATVPFDGDEATTDQPGTGS